MRIPTDQRNPYALYGFHSELLMDRNVDVTSSDKHEVFYVGIRLFLHQMTVLFCHSSSTIYHKRAAQSQSSSDSRLDRLFSWSKNPSALQTGGLHAPRSFEVYPFPKYLARGRNCRKARSRVHHRCASQLVNQSNIRANLVSGAPVRTLLCSRVNCRRLVSGCTTPGEPLQSCPALPLLTDRPRSS